MNEIGLLNEICSSADMGITGIHHVLPAVEDPSLRRSMETQKNGYQSIGKAAGKRLRELGETPRKAPAAAKVMSGVMADFKTMMDHSPSKIAEMMIQGSTMGITKMTRALHEYEGSGLEEKILAERLVRAEQENVEEMKQFL